MNLTNFLKAHNINNETTFGSFVSQRREELGVSLSTFEELTKIPTQFLIEIENGSREAPLSYLKDYQQILDISDKEYKLFLDIAYCTRKNHPDINDFVNNSPKIREFLRLAISKNISEEKISQLISNLKNNNLEDEMEQ